MAGIKFFQFRGQFPRIHPRNLPPGSAIKAQNCTLSDGVIRPIKSPTYVQDTAGTDRKTIFYYDPNNGGTTQWLEFANDTDVLEWPLGDDENDRLIYTDPSFSLGPRIADNLLIGSDGNTIDNYRELGIPAPEYPPTATVIGLVDTEINPDVRYYVCTFVNDWGQEGPPSPPSNQVEVNLGQRVEITALPSVPTEPAGAFYNITSRRLYRINVGSTGAAYQLVAEINNIAGSDEDVSSVTNGAPYTTVDMVSATTIDIGDSVEVGGDAGPVGSPVSISTVTYSASLTTITSSSHGLDTGDMVILQGFTTDTGAAELNNVKSVITRIDANNFSLDVLNGIDTTDYDTYDSGAEFQETNGLDLFVAGASFNVAGKLDTDTILLDVDTSSDLPLKAGTSVTLATTGGTQYNDYLLNTQLGEVLQTTTYDLPNSKLHGIVRHPAGFLIGFYENVVCFSEVGAPHAWPIEYRKTVESDIVGLGVFGNYVLVTTKGQPAMMFGNSPTTMTPVKMPLEQSCTSKRGIVDMGGGVVYPSPDGLMYVTQGQPVNLTENLFRKEDWEALQPDTFFAFNWERKYLCFFGDGSGVTNSFIIDPLRPDEGVVFFPYHATAGWKSIEEDILYLNINDEIVKWDNSSADTVVWRSREVELPKPSSFGWMQVNADNYPVKAKLLGDGVFRQEIIVQSDQAVRVPANFKAKKWQIELETKNVVSSFALSQTVRDLGLGVE